MAVWYFTHVAHYSVEFGVVSGDFRSQLAIFIRF